MKEILLVFATSFIGFMLFVGSLFLNCLWAKPWQNTLSLMITLGFWVALIVTIMNCVGEKKKRR